MKLLIATVLVAAALGAPATVHFNTQAAPTSPALHVAAESTSPEMGVQSVQGGAYNTGYTVQPAASDDTGRAYLQAQPDDPEIQPALGYQAIHWNIQ